MFTYSAKVSSRLSFSEVLSRVFDNDFGLSEEESSDEAGEKESNEIHVFTGPHTTDIEEVAMSGSFVTSREIFFSGSEKC